MVFIGAREDDIEYVIDATHYYGNARRPYRDFYHGADAAIIVDYINAFPKDISLQFAEYAVKSFGVCTELALMCRTGKWGLPIECPNIPPSPISYFKKLERRVVQT
jgi:hypothetical protein